jgi:hypothetical protein
LQAAHRPIAGKRLALENPFLCRSRLAGSCEYRGLSAQIGCSCILSTTNSSQNTDWEFEFIGATGYWTKLFLMTAPAPAQGGEYAKQRQRKALTRLFLTKSLETVWTSPVVPWPDIVAHSNLLATTCLRQPEDQVPCSIFDAEGSSHVLT